MTILVTGALGRIGRALQMIWADARPAGHQVIFSAGRPGPGVDLVWNIGNGRPPNLPKALIILNLAGSTQGSADQLAQNAAVTGAIGAHAAQIGAAHVFHMSSVALYGPGPADWREEDPIQPNSAYGTAKQAAEVRLASALAGSGTGFTQLRLANLAGADALLGGLRPGVSAILDPIHGHSGGPERSYIGPQVLASVLAQLFARVSPYQKLPALLNLAQPGTICMADLLTAAGTPWQFGPPRPEAVARLTVSTDRLAQLVSVPPATAPSLIADLSTLKGWPT